MPYREDGGYQVPPLDDATTSDLNESVITCHPDGCEACSVPGCAEPRDDHRPAAGRVTAGKGDYHELPALGIAAVARRLEVGLAKHGPGRAYLRDGLPFSVLIDKALRHTFQALAGDCDEDHLAAAAVNLLLLLEVRERIARGDLPPSLDDVWLA